MRLREKFKTRSIHRKAAREIKREMLIGKHFEDRVKKLSKKIAKPGEERCIVIVDRGSEKKYPGYKRLHEVCAAKDVQIEHKNIRYSGPSPHDCTAIFVVPNKPYSLSVDAGIHASKLNPIQLKFPGL